MIAAYTAGLINSALGGDASGRLVRNCGSVVCFRTTPVLGAMIFALDFGPLDVVVLHFERLPVFATLLILVSDFGGTPVLGVEFGKVPDFGAMLVLVEVADC